MRSRLGILLLSIVTACSVSAASNLGYWTVGVLRNVQHKNGWPALNQYDVVVVYRGKPMSEPNLLASGLFVRGQIDAAAVKNKDIHYALWDVHYRHQPFHCIIISELEPQELVDVEQFARDFKVVIVATSENIRSAPFAVNARDGAVYARSEVYTAYGFGLKPMPRIPIERIDDEPIAAEFEDLIRCQPTRADLDLKDWATEEICYASATEKQKNGALKDAILDLSVAVLLKPAEAFDHFKFARTWGFDSYHPYRDLAKLLVQFGRCNAVERALKHSKIAVAEKSNILKTCTGGTTGMLLREPSVRIAGGGGEVGERQAELLPPVAPLRWNALLTQ